ncbi:shikimate dehydrogenase [Thermodesulfitimonas autotrophica]|uniref:shikimate dehydrogenase n=1 Tax=Thermodesulfitimonas autotrophica TaxID=1894989 RepID=UPI002FE1E6B0
MINGETRVTGIFGDPVAHTLSPAMHNAAFTALGLNFVYLPFHVRREALAAAVAGIKALGLAGVNITVPHKEAVLPLLDDVAEEARLIGAVNTVVNRGGALVGYNTDATGFLRALQEAGFNPAGRPAVVIGAGGAARAVVVALARAGVRKITIFNRTLGRAAALAELVRAKGVAAAALPWADLAGAGKKVVAQAALVVQTTSVGMHPQEEEAPPVPPEALEPGQLVVDLIYSPPETRLLRLARAAGATTQNGMAMLLHQGAAAFELWTGREAPVGVMRAALENVLRSTFEVQG